MISNRLYQDIPRYRRFLIYKELWGVSSAGRASDLQSECRRFKSCTFHWTISITDRISRYEREDIGSTPIWSTRWHMLPDNNLISSGRKQALLSLTITNFKYEYKNKFRCIRLYGTVMYRKVGRKACRQKW